ncbi:hypothetical protein EVAR_74534_1 [Eumeta japonica]|uniref:Uncharacterized protein n=1 Tax=Eumeta variegata TaxID=151549 RepID=A0A4C1TBJ7_EUMVA|nr:hypothetical protein EVAR_74534_1 [Eumeta japonica]
MCFEYLRACGARPMTPGQVPGEKGYVVPLWSSRANLLHLSSKSENVNGWSIFQNNVNKPKHGKDTLFRYGVPGPTFCICHQNLKMLMAGVYSKTMSTNLNTARIRCSVMEFRANLLHPSSKSENINGWSTFQNNVNKPKHKGYVVPLWSSRANLLHLSSKSENVNGWSIFQNNVNKPKHGKDTLFRYGVQGQPFASVIKI